MSYFFIALNRTDGWEEDMKNFEYVKQTFDAILVGKNKIKINLIFFGLENGICFLSDSTVVKYMSENIPQFDHRERIWYTLAKEKNTTVWSPLYVDANTGELVTTLSKPIYIDGEFIGVLGLDLLLTTIKNEILDIRYEEAGIPLVVERNGNIIVHPEYTVGNKSWNDTFPEENILNIPSLSPLSDEIFNASTGFEIVNMDGKSTYAVFAPVDEINGSLLFLLPEEVVMRSINDTINHTIFFLILVFLFIVLVILLFVSSLTKPVEELRAGAMEVAKGNLDYKLDIKSNDEFGELSKDFNRMVERLKKTTQELKESQERYKSIFDESTDVIYITTEDGRVIDINKAGEKLFGYTREELMKMDPAEFYENKEDREKFKREIEKKGFVKDYEVRFRRKDGKLLDCILSTTMIKKGGKTYYQGIIRDVTPLKEAKRQLDMYNSLLRHDISNRNQITLGCLELLMEEDMDEEKKELIK
ncbi:MAG TPA: PAS domain S-box protein, partial [Candidatus Aciduliprofundum boonei]|nr:PAS domain S-box protein [Candidatus Aciduliprofundum boonei]